MRFRVYSDGMNMHLGKVALVMKSNALRQGIYLVITGIFLVFLFAACGKGTVNTEQPSASAPYETPASASAPDWVATTKEQGFQTHGQYIAAEATAMASGLYGADANEYFADTPTLAAALAYWKSSCQSANGSLCSAARSGNLQCVEFVSGAFASIDDQLPYIGNADQFWNLYRDKSGWQEIPASAVRTEHPVVGDMMAWSGEDSGHLAIVVDVQVPTGNQDGYIEVAQANAPGAFEQLTWHANGQIDSWSGYTLQGFIRQQQLAPCLQKQATPEQQQWSVLAIEAAVHYGVPSRYFLNQICQSGFQATDQQGKPVVSTNGGIGIVQMPASMAAQVPRCVTNFVNNAPDCMKMPGSLPTGVGIDPTKPAQALPAAAYEMYTLYQHYLQNKFIHAPQDDVLAYTMALAAYNAGTVTVDNAVNSCQKQWLDCLNQQQPDHQTSNYVHAILNGAM